MTAKTVETATETALDHLANKIKASLTRSDDLYLTAGQLCKEAKAMCKAEGIKFDTWLKQHGIGRSKAYVCLQIADGRKTVDDVRKETADRQKAHQAKNKAARKASKADPSEDGEGDDEQEDDMTPEHREMIKRLTSFIKTASPETLAKMCKAAKIVL